MRDTPGGTDMATTARLVTADELLTMPDDGKTFHELVRGELREVNATWWYHGRLATKLMLALGNFAIERGLGEVSGGDAGFLLFRDPDTVRSPDVGYVTAERIAS